ncbi:CARDB domain-containing protein [Nocardioides sp.]|uniref:CARDB domain-containing protein n=1 Tax=Nocardioides sp. TaxID=35761 RepID=UPI001A326363|nr:CARDB domain-containing protein [Nocardioides sp.]MBJ7359982.1 hypothetical protein [Nocardioides sp.]
MLPRSSGSLLASVLVATLVSTTFAASGSAAPGTKPPRADLKIAGGSITTSPVTITGSVRVKNTGKKKAKASTVSLLVDGSEVQGLALGKLAKKKSRVVTFSVPASVGRHTVSVCADARKKVKEKKEGNNCRALGQVEVPPTPSATAPTEPITYTPGTVFPVTASPLGYSLHVPTTYASHHQTPIGLVVFLHGCSSSTGRGQTMGQVIKDYLPQLVSSDYIVMTPEALAGQSCWDSAADREEVLAAIADVKTHFNIAPKKVILGGYSSGAFMAGAVAFANILQFAGVFSLNGPTFQGSSSEAEAIAAAGWKINAVMRAHADDGTVNVSVSRASRDALLDAGYPVQYSEVGGLDHAYVKADFEYLFGTISSSWSAP